MTWIKDDNGNKCSIEYFGSEEAAKVALASLKNCKDCTNCSRCFRCSGCFRCSLCFRCADCSGCSRCFRCSRCSLCSLCFRCSGCSDLKNSKPQEVEPIEVPVIPNIHTAVYQAASATPDSLNMGNWHTCETTHCRAGWVTHLAGPAGKALEEFHGGSTLMAAMRIYHASSPHNVSPVRFFEPNETAMADMKRMAEWEAGQ